MFLSVDSSAVFPAGPFVLARCVAARVAIRRDGLVSVRDEPETSGQRFRGPKPQITIIPSGLGRWSLSWICAREMTCDESGEVQGGRRRRRADRGAFVSDAICLQHLVVDERASRTNHGIDRFEHVRIGVRRVDGAQRAAMQRIICRGRTTE